MAPTLEVEVRDLVAMTQNLANVTNGFVGIKGFMADTHISLSNWPAVGWPTAGTYKQASSTAVDAADAVHGASDSTAKNLDDVARHYADAEYHSAIRPGAMPNTRPRANSGASVTLTNVSHMARPVMELGIAGQLLHRLSSAREQVKITARPTGLLAIFLAVDALVVEPNLRDSGPFREARDTWRAIAESNIKPLRDELGKHLPIQTWDGDAVASFNAHMGNRYLPALERLEALATSMGDLCDEMATGMDRINKLWLALLLKTAVKLVVIEFTPLPYRPIVSSVILGMFLADVIWLYVEMRSWFSGKAAAVKTMEQQAAELAADCFDDTQALEDNRNLLKPHFTMVSDRWTSADWAHNWHYKADT
jgi:hypothetical protein